ncbi:thioredoxin family protein [Pedobacter nyackensis]|uniref:thioredoxin family protein n=1 Tax=Pedobacter nyackensis TaxID=475255 RepID=UPI00292E6C68|nr:thioredoxin fold domain-containing protein [Pedobacter nyackensis]
MKQLKIYFSLVLTLLAFTGSAQQNQFRTATDWNSILSQAKKENKLIFIDAYFVGCHPCKQMEEEVFVLPDVSKQMADNFVNFKIDFFKEPIGKALQIKYAVTGFPTYLILNKDGQLISASGGYQEADKFKKLLSEAVSKSKKGIVLNGFSTTLKVNHPDFYREMFTGRKFITKEKLVPYLKGKDLFAEVNAVPLLVSNVSDQELGDQLIKNYKKLENLYGRNLVWSRVMEILGSRISKDIPAKDDAKFEAYLTQIKPLFAKEDWPYARLDLAEAHYLNQLKDNKAFFQYAIKNYNDDENKVRYIGSRLARPGIALEDKQLYSEWVKLVVHENSGYDVLVGGVRIMKELNNAGLTKKYAGWGIKKAQLINKSAKYFESALN